MRGASSSLGLEQKKSLREDVACRPSRINQLLDTIYSCGWVHKSPREGSVKIKHLLEETKNEKETLLALRSCTIELATSKLI